MSDQHTHLGTIDTDQHEHTGHHADVHSAHAEHGGNDTALAGIQKLISDAQSSSSRPAHRRHRKKIRGMAQRVEKIPQKKWLPKRVSKSQVITDLEQMMGEAREAEAKIKSLASKRQRKSSGTADEKVKAEAAFRAIARKADVIDDVVRGLDVGDERDLEIPKEIAVWLPGHMAAASGRSENGKTTLGGAARKHAEASGWLSTWKQVEESDSAETMLSRWQPLDGKVFPDAVTGYISGLHEIVLKRGPGVDPWEALNSASGDAGFTKALKVLKDAIQADATSILDDVQKGTTARITPAHLQTGSKPKNLPLPHQSKSKVTARAHLLGRVLGGSGELENLVEMYQSDNKAMYDQWEGKVQDWLESALALAEDQAKGDDDKLWKAINQYELDIDVRAHFPGGRTDPDGVDLMPEYVECKVQNYGKNLAGVELPPDKRFPK